MRILRTKLLVALFGLLSIAAIGLFPKAQVNSPFPPPPGGPALTR
jgi:hypothetical protein